MLPLKTTFVVLNILQGRRNIGLGLQIQRPWWAMDQLLASIFNDTARPSTSNNSDSQRGGTVSGNSSRAIIQVTSVKIICNSFTGRLEPSKRDIPKYRSLHARQRDKRSGGDDGRQESKRGPL